MYFMTSALKMEVVCSSKMLVTTYKTTWPNNPEDYSLHFFIFLKAIYFVKEFLM
jgi:hypothetical protein